jgi:20S proteasome alpha/beta subunit
VTVCVGAICEQGKTVVVAADKMVTFGPPMNLQTEPASLRKIKKLSDESVLLFSGSVPDGEELISATIARINTSQKQPTAQIAEAAKEAYAELKKKRVEDAILKPLLGANFGQFQTLVGQSPSSQILQQVLGMIMQHNLQLEALVAGEDDTGAHLFIVAHPGVLLPVETTGYAAIGSGGLHAAVRLSLGQHSKETSMDDAVYNVYEAKKAAEVAPGVGKMTDMAVIKGKRVLFADQPIFDALERAHKEKPTMTPSEQEDLRKVCDAWTNY